MTQTKKPEVYATIQQVALARYGELLAPELAHEAASQFAEEASEMVEQMLAEAVRSLRAQIEGQLAISQGNGKGGAKKKRAGKKPAAKVDADKLVDSAPKKDRPVAAAS